MFMNTTLRAAVHLGKDHETNLHYSKNHLWDSLGQIFCEIERLISEQSEILGAKTPEIVGLKIIEFFRNYVEIDKLIVRKSSSDHCC